MFGSILKLAALLSDIWFTLKPVIKKVWIKFEQKSRLDKAKKKVKTVMETNKAIKNAKNKAKYMADYFKPRD